VVGDTGIEPVTSTLDFRGYAAARAQACRTSRISSVVAGRAARRGQALLLLGVTTNPYANER